MSAALRLIDGLNSGDFAVPDHEGTLRFLATLLIPVFVPEGERHKGRPRITPRPDPKPSRSFEVPAPPERTNLPEHLATRERAAYAAVLEPGTTRPSL